MSILIVEMNTAIIFFHCNAQRNKPLNNNNNKMHQSYNLFFKQIRFKGIHCNVCHISAALILVRSSQGRMCFKKIKARNNFTNLFLFSLLPMYHFFLVKIKNAYHRSSLNLNKALSKSNFFNSSILILM